MRSCTDVANAFSSSTPVLAVCALLERTVLAATTLRGNGDRQMMPEMNEGQRLQYAIQAAMRAVQNRTGSAGGHEFGQGENQLDQVRHRIKEAVRDRVAQ
ncbi:MAG TPA: hypothetical protein VF469_22560, partial [Kofleriaceae bacterium]